MNRGRIRRNPCRKESPKRSGQAKPEKEVKNSAARAKEGTTPTKKLGSDEYIPVLQRLKAEIKAVNFRTLLTVL